MTGKRELGIQRFGTDDKPWPWQRAAAFAFGLSFALWGMIILAATWILLS